MTLSSNFIKNCYSVYAIF